MLDYTKITNVKFDDVDHNDYPDYCDAYISEAHYDGVEMTQDQLDDLNGDVSFVYEKLMEFLN
jgi:hypothetical protein